MSKWLRKGDKVVATAGNDRGKSGIVLRRTKDRIVVEGVNIRKKHVRPTEENRQGGVAEFEMPFHISNVSACDGEGKAVKLRVRLNEKGERELFYRSGEREHLYRAIKRAGK